MSAFLEALRGEWKALRGDGGAQVVLVGAIVLYAVVYPLPYSAEVVKEVPVAAVDLDHSSLSRRALRMADAHELLAVVSRPASVAEAEAEVRAGTVAGVIVVPEGLERDILRGRRATVGTHVDAAYFLAYRQALTGLSEALGTLSAGVEVRRLEAQGTGRERALALREALPLVTRPLFNPVEGYLTYVVPAVLVLILQQTLLVGIGMMGGTEREAQGGEGLRPSPGALERLARVAGRTAFYLGLYSLHAGFYVLVLPWAYGYPRAGAASDLALFTVPFLLSCVLLALALAPLFPRRETSIQALLATSLVAVFLAGFSWPPEAIPAWLRALALLLPSTSAIPGLLRIGQMGAGLRHVRFEWTALWTLVALYLPLAWRAEALRSPAPG